MTTCRREAIDHCGTVSSLILPSVRPSAVGLEATIRGLTDGDAGILPGRDVLPLPLLSPSSSYSQHIAAGIPQSPSESATFTTSTAPAAAAAAASRGQTFTGASGETGKRMGRTGQRALRRTPMNLKRGRLAIGTYLCLCVQGKEELLDVGADRPDT